MDFEEDDPHGPITALPEPQPDAAGCEACGGLGTIEFVPERESTSWVTVGRSLPEHLRPCLECQV